MFKMHAFLTTSMEEHLENFHNVLLICHKFEFIKNMKAKSY